MKRSNKPMISVLLELKFNGIKYLSTLVRPLLLSTLFIIFSSFLNKNGEDLSSDRLSPPYLCCEHKWADSVLAALSPEQRIAQLFMVAAYSNRDQQHVGFITKLIEDYGIGGLIFFQGGPVREAKLTNLYQSISNVPLMIAMDAEWGLGMRLDSTTKFPYQMALGAIQDNRLIYDMGAEIARQSKLMGIHVNFAPVVDVNNNRNNPVINYRSFGEDRENVAAKGISYMKGLQDNHVLANAKHFPGHGDTDTDSHLALPVISHPHNRLDSLELYPFKELVSQGLGSMMIAHLYVPAYEKKKNIASTLSKNIVTHLLRDSLGFDGLIFTDALNMRGVSKYFGPGEVDVRALLAGNDVLLFAENVPLAIEKIKKAIKKGLITQEEIDGRCLNILKAKKWMQLDDYKALNLDQLINNLNIRSALVLKRKLIESSLTLIKNEKAILPIDHLDKKRIASLSIGNKEPGESYFQLMMDNYAPIDHFNLTMKPTPAQIAAMADKLSAYNLVLVGIHSNTNSPRRNFGISSQCDLVLLEISKNSDVILTSFSNPYGLSSLTSLKDLDGILVSYSNNRIEQELSAQLLFGGISAGGKLPVSISKEFPFGLGIETQATRLKYTLPEELGISSSKLDSIDTLVARAIKAEATPGCQVMVAVKGKVIYQKAFGHHTYDQKKPVLKSDLYDLASLTKILASTSSLIKLQGEGKFSMDSTLGHYLPELDTADERDLVIQDVLTHHAGLKSWVPFWLNTMDNVKYSVRKKAFETQGAKYKDGMYSTTETEEHPIKVAKNLYLIASYKDSIYDYILRETVELAEKKYLYSDLGYYFVKKIIEKLTETTLDTYVRESFYAPLGLRTLCYNPEYKFDLDRIVPTEDDKIFRRQLVHGTVHDPGAAMLGGVGGHAGLFSNANDLGIYMQMLLNGGAYGGKKYLDDSIINLYSNCQFCDDDEKDNRRGAGFDKPEMDYTKDGPTCQCISQKSFGHTGFTGTLIWADPEKEVVYVFLSNRVHPDSENKSLVQMNVRTDIMQAIYDALADINL
ncbi:MAG TPA: serine hydrolase [Flavobacteriales bacterium]|nr:serine hydrolase [Flavobacteriales bacterium]